MRLQSKCNFLYIGHGYHLFLFFPSDQHKNNEFIERMVTLDNSLESRWHFIDIVPAACGLGMATDPTNSFQNKQ